MANDPKPNASSEPKPDNQRVQDMYDDPDETEGQEQPQTAGDRVHNYANNASQDYQDADNVSGGKLGEGVKSNVNDLKDKYFPKKEDEKGEGDEGKKDGDKPEDGKSDAKDDDLTDATGNKADNLDQPGIDAAGGKGEGLSKPGTDAAGGKGENLSKPGTDAAGGKGENLSKPGTDAAGNLGDGAKKAVGSAQNVGNSVDTGAKVADAADKTAKVADAATKVGQVAAEGGELAVGAGSTAATGGVAAGVIAAGKAAKAAYEAGKTAAKLVKEGLKLKERAESAGRLVQKYWKCGCCLFIPLIMVIGIVYSYVKLLHLDLLSSAGQAIVSLFHRNTASGNLQFTDPASQDAIKNGDISESAIRVLNGISSKYKITVNFTGTSTVTGQENQPYEFDITTAGVIDCALGNEKLTPIPISLSPNFNWSNTIVADKESASCAVGYYPGLDSPISGEYSYLDPGVFSLQNISTFGPKASLEESARVIDDASSINSTAVANTDQQDIPLKKLTLNSDIYNPISSSIETSIKGAYPDQVPSEIIVKSPSAQGIHFEFD